MRFNTMSKRPIGGGSIFALLIVLNLFFSPSESTYDRQMFKEILRGENANRNDDLVGLNTTDLLRVTGFKSEEYYVVAEDGYVTQLVRIINPQVRPGYLKPIPIMLYHGANIDSSAYLAASTKDHFPEKYPRPNGKKLKSSRRALGFALANEGYDVWLIGSRGSNKENRAYVYRENITQAINKGLFYRPNEDDLEFSKTKEYWTYSLDSIIDYDIKKQIDTVKQVANSSTVSIFSFSLSAPTTMAFLAENPDYAQNVAAYIQMAPAISAYHSTWFSKTYFERICPKFPTQGVGFTPTFWVKPAAKAAILALSKSYDLRYGFVRKFLNSLFGKSAKYQTNLELNMLSRIFKKVSFKSIQQYCQQSVSKQLNRFDYGPKINTCIYADTKPPSYNVRQLLTQTWLVIGGTDDVLADSLTVSRLYELTESYRKTRVQVSAYNHLDMIAGVEVDRYVNDKIIQFLKESYHLAETRKPPSDKGSAPQPHDYDHDDDDDDEDDGVDVHIS